MHVNGMHRSPKEGLDQQDHDGLHMIGCRKGLNQVAGLTLNPEISFTHNDLTSSIRYETNCYVAAYKPLTGQFVCPAHCDIISKNEQRKKETKHHQIIDERTGSNDSTDQDSPSNHNHCYTSHASISHSKSHNSVQK